MVPKFSILFHFILFFLGEAHTTQRQELQTGRRELEPNNFALEKSVKSLAVTFTWPIADDLQIQLENTMKTSALNIQTQNLIPFKNSSFFLFHLLLKVCFLSGDCEKDCDHY